MIFFWRTRRFEQFAPAGLGLLALGLIAFYRVEISAKFLPGGWDSAGLFSAVFNWASIQSGFVFGIYGFIASKKDGFAGEFAKGQSFLELLTYARRAYQTGFALTFTSLPIMVVGPKIVDPTSAPFWIIAVWFAAFVWTFCAFLRVAFIFGMVAAVPDKKPVLVG